ncbi:MAG: hypothetical protein CMJ52_10870 [Planctomycetaceae bacterium]|nr:hypothetical protein [Planctomycetaceae bacterium]
MSRVDMPAGWRLVNERIPSEATETTENHFDAGNAGHAATVSPVIARIDVEQVLRAADQASRRMEDLARELHCLGDFDHGNDDGPRAA